jgi:UDP-N-acetylmuramate dehydrogenase
METLPIGLKKAGVVPAGYLIEAAGLKGFRMGGAMLGERHANFMLNVGNATSFEIRRLAEHAKQVVRVKFGVELEEEVLYLGDWTRFKTI